MMKIMLIVATIFAAVSWAEAGPSANRIKSSGLLDELIHSGDESPVKPVQPVKKSHSRAERAEAKNFDGVWVGSSDQIQLIKRIHKNLYLSGSSEHSAWQVQCVLQDVVAKCIGSGISQSRGEFTYESELRKSGAMLQENWTKNYSSGQSDSGSSDYHKEI